MGRIACLPLSAFHPACGVSSGPHEAQREDEGDSEDYQIGTTSLLLSAISAF